MKKIYSTIAVLAISSLSLLSSCSKDDSDGPINPASPESTVSLNENTNTSGSDTLYVKRDKMNAVIQVNGVSKSTTDMKRIYVYKKSSTVSGAVVTPGSYATYNGGSGFSQDANNNYYYDIPADQKNNASLTLTVPLAANNAAAFDEYYFAFTDGTSFDGPSNTSGLLLGPAKIYIAYGVLSEANGYRVNNIYGPNSGAFDLATLTNKSASDPVSDKDMVDADPITQTAVWSQSFEAANSTLFAKIPSSFDYANATDISIKAAYALAANATGTQSAVTAGNLYVAKLRNLDQYVLIKITYMSTESGSVGTGNNGEFMEFSVKK
ncbi:hypothetical protein [Cytophaga aurantiaca]|uniref:hypothetical protein n=1 Tax=Cytophaga aurantiaca TaxID=29530 RepID=UPI0003750705|nr:hypothetical protein [Cytophaga aurantiaca]